MSATHDVAQYFVTKILGRQWEWNLPHCRRALSDAKFYVNPKKGVKMSPDGIIRTLDAMKAAGLNVTTIHCISWKNRDDPQGRTWYDSCKPKLVPQYETLARRWNEN